MNIKDNWQTWLKILGVTVAVIAWALTTQAKVEEHMTSTHDTVKLLLLICKNTATPHEISECYDAIGRR